MPNEVLIGATGGTPQQIVFANHAGDFGPTAANDLRQGTTTNVELALASLADGSARQSAKADFGVKRARLYAVTTAFEFAATPVAGEIVELYWASSPDATAANGNPGGTSGSDAAYTGYSSNLADSVKHLMFLGAHVVTVQVTTVVQIAFVTTFAPPDRYGNLVIKNEASAAFHSDDVESHVVFTPIFEEVQ